MMKIAKKKTTFKLNITILAILILFKCLANSIQNISNVSVNFFYTRLNENHNLHEVSDLFSFNKNLY